MTAKRKPVAPLTQAESIRRGLDAIDQMASSLAAGLREQTLTPDGAGEMFHQVVRGMLDDADVLVRYLSAGEL